MALLLTEADVAALLPPAAAVSAVEAALERCAAGECTNLARRRVGTDAGTFHLMAAADHGLGTYAIKSYASFPPAPRFLVLLYSAETGDLLSVMEADRLGQRRTGAASAVATVRLSRPEPLRIALFGAGWQAESQLECIAAVRDIASVTVIARHADRAEAFARAMGERLGVAVTAGTDPVAAVGGSNVVITATTSREPVIPTAAVQPGTHINAIGANMLSRREYDTELVRRAGQVVVDSVEQAQAEAGALVAAVEARAVRWEQVVTLQAVAAGQQRRRTNDEITLFHSSGIALEDVAVATAVYRAALENGAGTDVPLWTGSR